MFRGLTPRAQRVLMIGAQEVAKRFHSDQLYPEHILIAVLKDGEGLACAVLSQLRIDIQDLRFDLERSFDSHKTAIGFGDIPPAKRTRQLLETAAEEARALGNEYIGTEHILFAAAIEPDSRLKRYLDRLAVNSIDLKNAILAESKHSANTRMSSFPFAESGGLERLASVKPADSMTPLLDEHARDLTAMASEEKLDPVIGRVKEIDRLIRILVRRTKNNPILVGEPGTGKTAIVEGLALMIAAGSAPELLSDKRILALDLASVVAGTKYRGEFEERLKKLLKETIQAKNIILFIDEIHTIIGAGGAEGSIDAANMLKPALSRGEIQCIGATTSTEYRKHFEKDAALERRFQKIVVEPPDAAETLIILEGIRHKYESYHGVRYEPKALAAAAGLSDRYLTDRFLPDKAIDLLDEAGAKKRLEADPEPHDIQAIEEDIKRLSEDKAKAVSAQDYEKAAAVRDEVRRLREHLEAIREAWLRIADRSPQLVTEADIANIVSDICGVPASRLAESEASRLLLMEGELHRTIIGQDEAVSAVSSAIRRSRSGISSPKRPLGSFVFLGPTGVGKTLLAKRLAEYLFGKESALIRIDMSDYMEKHNVSRLVGAPPGYIGYEEGGTLTERIRRNPYRVVLFDEIEKAHRDVFNLLLQVLEEGELKDNLGHTVNFRNTVIIMTSNVGAREISQDAKLGFAMENELPSDSDIRSSALSELKRSFNPEFLNRIDEIVVFKTLNRKQLSNILTLQLEELNERLFDKGIELKVDDKAKSFLLERGWDPRLGARPLRRAVQKEVEDPLSRWLLETREDSPCLVGISERDGQIRFEAIPSVDESAKYATIEK